MSRTDINKVAETILIPLLAEVYGFTDLKNLNYTEDSNYPGIDLGDETERVAFQVTSTSDSVKIKHTLDQFVENKFYEKYDKLIIYILKKKQKSYSGSGYDEIIQGKFTFDKDKDIWDYRDILREVGNFQIDKARKVESILEANFGEGRRLPEWEVVDKVEQVINESTQLFVGRSEEFQKLDEFLRENSRGVILVKAGAGFGKTALLANWVKGSRDKDCFIAYHFFSQRYDVTRSVARAYRNLLRQLYIYYELSYEQPPNDENQLRERLYSILREHGAREDKPLVIVLDGLDEAERPFSPPFPPPLPEKNVFVIASGRAEEGEEPEYLRDWIDSAESIRLNRLCRGAIAQWLRNTDELAAFAEDTHFVAQLDEITQGFPLYLRYLTEELSHAAKQGQDVRELLAQTPKGFERYVEQQLRGLDELELPDERWQFFALLAVAKGVLEKEDVKALTGIHDRQLRQLHQSWQVTRWMRISEGKLYAFAHPLLATTFAAQLGDDAEDALHDLIDYCAKWEKYQSRYALRHYAEHLHEVKRWEELYAIARNEDFATTQRERLPNEPDLLPVKTVQIALRGAADTDNAEAMAEFLLLHAERMLQTTQRESPLDALRTGSLKRALALADWYEIEPRILWYLLLAWELKDNGRLEEARKTLEQLQDRELPSFSGWQSRYGLINWQSHYAAFLLTYIFEIDKRTFNTLYQKLLDDNAHIVLLDNFIAQGHLTAALEFAQQIDNKLEIVWALKTIVAGTATVKDFSRALETLTQINSERLEITELVIEKIAIAMTQTGNFSTALDIAMQISNEWKQIIVLGEIASAMAKAEDSETDKSTLATTLEILKRKLETAKHSAEVVFPSHLADIAVAIAQARDFHTALETLGQVYYDWEKAEALSKIAVAMVQAGDTERAKSILATAREIAQQIDCRSRPKILGKVAAAMVQAGDYESAQSIFATAIDEAKWNYDTKNEPWMLHEYEYDPPKALLDILAIAQTSNSENARSSLASAIKMTCSTNRGGSTDRGERARTDALGEIALIIAQTGNFTTALQTLQLVDDGWKPEWVLWKIGESVTQAVDFDTALEIVKQIKDKYEQAHVLAGIAVGIAEKGDFDTALEIAKQVKEKYRVDVFGVIAVAMAEKGNSTRALETARQISDESEQTGVLGIIERSMPQERHSDTTLELDNQIDSESQREESLTETCGEANFKKHLTSYAHYLDTAYMMCGHLARLYPDRAAAVAKVVSEFDREYWEEWKRLIPMLEELGY